MAQRLPIQENYDSLYFFVAKKADIRLEYLFVETVVNALTI